MRIEKNNAKNNRKNKINIDELEEETQDEYDGSNNYTMIFILFFILFLIFFVSGKLVEKIGGNQKKQLMKFFSTYDILGIFIGWSISSAGRDLSTSLIESIIMPIISPMFKYGDWKTPTIIGPFTFYFGNLIKELINFLLTVAVIYGVYLFVAKHKFF